MTTSTAQQSARARTSAAREAASATPGRFSQLAPLIVRRDSRAVDAYRAGASRDELRAFGRSTASVVTTTAVIVSLELVTVGLSLAFTLVMGFVVVMHGGPMHIVLPIFLVILAFTALIWFTFGRWLVRILKREWRYRGSWTHRWRLARFAADNRLGYLPTGTNVPRIGSVLTGIRAKYWDVFTTWVDGRAAVFGNAKSDIGGSSMHAPSGWTFLSIKLPTQVPHMYLQPRRKGLMKYNSPLVVFKGDQRMKLEGDFDRHFTLYAPKDYERDALYVITPDLMALLIDELPGSHVETYADTMVITSPTALRFEHLDSWDRISRLLDTVVKKTMRQTRNYQDTRSDVKGQVAATGRRMRYGIPIVSVIALIYLIAQIIRLVNQLT